jgi:hypothetical protein
MQRMYAVHGYGLHPVLCARRLSLSSAGNAEVVQSERTVEGLRNAKGLATTTLLRCSMLALAQSLCTM